jgi:F0F1-type ATP synthase assembly protein I
VDQKKPEPARYAMNLTLAAVAGQVGCLTIVIIFAALLGGLWLDNQFGTRPLFIVGLLLVSVPVTLVTMFWVVRQATSRIKPQQSQGQGSSPVQVNTEED